MEKITLENIGQEYPNLVNYELIKEKGFGEDKPNEEYFELLNRYIKLFGQYLMEILPLEQIDTNMKNHESKFVPVKDEDKDFYQITSPLSLEYIYLRNNFYIEKLSKEDLDILRTKDSLDGETREFIKRTYLNVINPYEDKEVIFYGPENSRHLCDSTDVVLGIRYDEFSDIGLSNEEFQQRFLEQQQKIGSLGVILEVVGLDKLGTELRLINYNEASIMRKYREGEENG